MSHPPYGMEKEVTQVQTHHYPQTVPYHPFNSPTVVQPSYGMSFSKPGCFREKKPCAGCIWRNECGNVENCPGDK